ncbi:MAG: hypothetical protein C0596_05065 [Marinilabiliales bacterium]|nr:MAG: hypothetical protein C0596_05065 [Marinilabiliales bacterium]
MSVKQIEEIRLLNKTNVTIRKLLLSLVVVLFSFYAIAQQTQVIPLSAGENQLELKSVNPESFNA